jgi:hypothetical protein
MNPLVEAARAIQELCVERGLGFCFIGGLAVLRWGEPRLTRDVDLTVLAPYGSEPEVVDTLVQRFDARLPDARAFAIENRVVLLRAANGTPIDVALGAIEFEQRAVARATAWDVSGTSLVTCSAEDLVVQKAFAGRAQDWLDIEGIAARRSTDLDRALILLEVEPLLALRKAPADVDRLRGLLSRA